VVAVDWSHATWVAPSFAAVTGLDPDVFRADPTTLSDLVAVMDRRHLDLLAGDRSGSATMRVRDLTTGDYRSLLCVVEPIADDRDRSFVLTVVDLEAVDHRIGELEAEVGSLSVRLDHQRWLSAELGHDLRSPLNALLGSSQMLESADLDPRGRRAAERMASAGAQLRVLIDALLDIERLEAGGMQLHRQPVNAELRVIEVLNALTPLAARRSVTLASPAMGRSDSTLLGDEAAIDRILSNLVTNAIKFTPVGGDVTVSVSKSGTSVRVAVLDSGPGIAESDRLNLFEPYERLHADRDGVPGTGIGLALCRRLVEAMGGTIGVEGSPRGGSRFWFSLPAASEGALAATSTASSTPTVLAIEDDPDNQELLTDALATVDVQTFTASSATRGLEMIESLRPAVVIVDAHLPDMATHTFFTRLAEAVRHSGSQVIVVSGSVEPGELDRHAEIIAAHHVKPVDLDALVADVVSALGTRRRPEAASRRVVLPR
jgi:signal transduction histidine kinase/ActR/RegA family two-component response regulator